MAQRRPASTIRSCAAAGGDRRVRQLWTVHRGRRAAAGPHRARGLQNRLLCLLRPAWNSLLQERRRAVRGAAGRAAHLQLHPVHGERRPSHPLPQAPPRHHRRRRALRQGVPPQSPPRGLSFSSTYPTPTPLRLLCGPESVT
uniref:Uncharacterized protein n=1 Tax=Zea mays TaxID=4577 RepID=C4J626_MAIZE|nr:unknown [Zea mays]